MLNLLKRNKAQAVPPPEWEYLPGTWDQALQDRQVRGWDADGVVRTQLAAWPAFLESIAAPRAFDLAKGNAGGDISFHNGVMSFAYVLSLTAAKTGGRVRCLDWGGGVGHYYRLARALFPDMRFDYMCKEMPKLCLAGARLNPEASFVSDETICREKSFDLVMASTSLHYSPDWQAVLRNLIGCAVHYVFINRLPVVMQHASYIMVQRPYRYGYETEYIGWCVNQSDFLAGAQRAGARLERMFLCGEGNHIKVQGAPEQACYKGFLFSIDTH
jgi:putative methyltransferase (TIGR04325 family)